MCPPAPSSWCAWVISRVRSPAPTRSPTQYASTRRTRARGPRAEQPPATSARRWASRPRPRLREPHPQHSYKAASPRPTRAGRGSVHHRAPASRRRPARAVQRRRCGPRSTRPAHRAIPRATIRRQTAVTTARSIRPPPRLTPSQPADSWLSLAVPTIAEVHSDQFLLPSVIVGVRNRSRRSAKQQGRCGLRKTTLGPMRLS
jgi:hypothetical protein